ERLSLAGAAMGAAAVSADVVTTAQQRGEGRAAPAAAVVARGRLPVPRVPGVHDHRVGPAARRGKPVGAAGGIGVAGTAVGMAAGGPARPRGGPPAAGGRA